MKFLFLLAWVEGSDSADEPTNIHSQDDLLIQYSKDNQNIFAVQINIHSNFLGLSSTATSLEKITDIARTFGYAEAFRNNYTAQDSVSTCEIIDDIFKHPGEKPIYQINLG